MTNRLNPEYNQNEIKMLDKMSPETALNVVKGCLTLEQKNMIITSYNEAGDIVISRLTLGEIIDSALDNIEFYKSLEGK
jgi:ArsR family metal-binding transcriptional regulator